MFGASRDGRDEAKGRIDAEDSSGLGVRRFRAVREVREVERFFSFFFRFLSETKTNHGSFLNDQSRGLERDFEFTAEIN